MGLPVIGNIHLLGAVAGLAARHAADALRAALQPSDWAMSGRRYQALAAAARMDHLTYGLQHIVLSPPDGAFGRAARPSGQWELDAFYSCTRCDRRPPDLNKSAVGSKGEDLVDVTCSSRLHGDLEYNSTFNSRDQQVKGILMDMFGAGTDTAAATVEWKYDHGAGPAPRTSSPRCRRRRVAGGGSGFVIDSGSDLLSMRVHPPVPLLVTRETIEPCTVYGVEVPAGTTRVHVNVTAIGKDPGVWGPDAARFAPTTATAWTACRKSERNGALAFGQAAIPGRVRWLLCCCVHVAWLLATTAGS
ncbi:unnamed protein product [Urochloa humidicola]